jgi:hypothetical protein
MLFSKDMLELVLAEKKTQTRRPADITNEYSKLSIAKDCRKAVLTRKWLGLASYDTLGGPVVFDEFTDWRIKWHVGKTYAIASGRGKKGVARIELLDIRREPACDITVIDAMAEGFSDRDGFFDKLRDLYGKDVDLSWPYYALTFKLVQS